MLQRLVAWRIRIVPTGRTTIVVVNAGADCGCADRGCAIVPTPIYAPMDPSDAHWCKWSPNSGARRITASDGTVDGDQ